MHLSLIQILLVAISSYYIVNRVTRFLKKERTQTGFKLVTTLLVWGGVLVTSLFPGQIHDLSRTLGFGENLNTLIFFGFVVIFALLFKMLSSIENLERSLTDIVRREALKDLPKID
jgi:hypothetical protein